MEVESGKGDGGGEDWGRKSGEQICVCVRERERERGRERDNWMRETIKYDILVLPSSYNRIHIHHLIVHSW